MASKALFLLAIILASAAAVLATAAEQTHENIEKMANNDNAGASGGGYGYACEYGCCNHVFHGGCQKCCPPPPPGAGRGPEEVKN